MTILQDKPSRLEQKRQYKKTAAGKQACRNATIRWKYGITPEEYDEIVAQGCGICGTHEGRICLDHDHSTGEIRGALCHHCNLALGHFGDDPARLRAGAEYLE